MASETCAFCDKPSVCNGRQGGPPVNLCNTHYARYRRGIPMDAPIRGVHASQLARLLEAALVYAAAETEADHYRAKHRVIQAAMDYARPKVLAKVSA